MATESTHISTVNQGINYIHDHLFEKLNVEEIADHCCFSRFYFNRLFKSITGYSVYSFIKKLRLETAAFKLIKFPHLKVTDIAADMGYSSSNFTVLFKEQYGCSPLRFRKKPVLPDSSIYEILLQRIQEKQQHRPEELLRTMDSKISFEDSPELLLRYKRMKVNYRNLLPHWNEFCTEMTALYPGQEIRYYGISYDDPLIVGEESCYYDLCAAVPRLPDGEYRKIKAGRFLVYHFDDHISKLAQSFSDISGIWMPHRGYSMANGLCLERYHTGMGPDGQIRLDICIPI